MENGEDWVCAYQRRVFGELDEAAGGGQDADGGLERHAVEGQVVVGRVELQFQVREAGAYTRPLFGST